MQQQPSPSFDSNPAGSSNLGQPSQSSHSNGNTITNGNSSSSDSADEDQISIRFADWGFKIDRLFEVAYRFYKRNESKAFHPSFDERNKMIALVMQARYGNHDSGRAPDVGVLDFVGQRRQHEWSMLKGMSKTEAMSKFICALDLLCPLFKAHAEAVKISSGIVEGNNTIKSTLGPETIDNEPSKIALDPQMHNIYSSLCKQTYNQFKGYAEKQYPGDSTQQKYLITSLQEQYYQQYISQMHPELKSSLPSSSQASNQSNSNIPSSLPSPAISDKSNSINESIVNNQSGDPSMIPENQLTLIPTTPHLELPLPPKEIFTPDQRIEEKTKDEPKVGNINESIYPSDIYCEENNVQADISSEELNSDSTANDAVLASRDTVDGYAESKLKEEIKSISIEPKESKEIRPRNGNIKEPVRLSRSSDIAPIGVFESFPEPRPIKSSSQKSTPIDQINPNLPRAFSEAEAKREGSHDTHADSQSSSTNLKEAPTSQQPILPNDVFVSQPLREQSISSQQFTVVSYDNEVCSDSTPEPAPQCLNSQTDSLQISLNQDTENKGDPSAPSINESHNETSQVQVPELWDCTSDGDQSPGLQGIIPYQEPEPATIWSKREVAEFKESLDNDKQGGIYEVKESTLVIFEVPTYPDGKYIYWEFATDDFDIGFGLEFVHEQQISQPLALNIYEDVDEDDMDDIIEGESSNLITTATAQFDPESGQMMRQDSTSGPLDVRRKILAEKRRRQGNTISIVPTYRRDSHQEVFVGRHKYPGRGHYLLRFDNTYSVLRSKTLYFRICYFM